MLSLPPELGRRYDTWLECKGIAVEQRPHYRKWLRFYWDFCHKYAFEPTERQSFPAFHQKLRAKNQPEALCRQAEQAVALYYEMVLSDVTAGRVQPAAEIPLGAADKRSALLEQSYPSPSPTGELVTPTPAHSPPFPDLTPTSPRPTAQPELIAAPSPRLRPPQKASPSPPTATAKINPKHDNPDRSVQARVEIAQDSNRTAGDLKLTGASWVWVYDRLDSAIKVRHYSPKTLQVYKFWTQKFQTFTKSKDPQLVSTEDVKSFLSFLAVDKNISASSQNQAFNALLFLFKHILEKDFGRIEGVVRAKRRPYIPVVLSREEVHRVIGRLDYPYDLVAKLLYGCGLRLFECLKLRVQDFNFDMQILTVHDGKGQKDRTVPLPQVLLPELKTQLERVMQVHQADLAANYAGTFLPSALAMKYKQASRELVWQWFFPAKTLTLVPATGQYQRYHLHETHVQRAIKQAVK